MQKVTIYLDAGMARSGSARGGMDERPFERLVMPRWRSGPLEGGEVDVFEVGFRPEKTLARRRVTENVHQGPARDEPRGEHRHFGLAALRLFPFDFFLPHLAVELGNYRCRVSGQQHTPQLH